MSERLRIERPDPAEAPDVRDLHHEAFKTAPEYIPEAPDPDLEDVPDHYLERDGEFLVGRHEGELVAMGAYLPAAATDQLTAFGDLDAHPAVAGATEPVATLKRLRVAPDHRRQGYAHAITRELTDRAREEGFRSLTLDTGAANEAARGFYETLGFDLVAERTVDFGPIEQDLAFYRRRIDD